MIEVGVPRAHFEGLAAMQPRKYTPFWPRFVIDFDAQSELLKKMSAMCQEPQISKLKLVYFRFNNDENNTLKPCDTVIWIGDLNYRLANDELTADEIRDLALKWEIEPLLK